MQVGAGTLARDGERVDGLPANAATNLYEGHTNWDPNTQDGRDALAREAQH